MREKIEPIDLHALGRFGIGSKSNSLYFDDQRVHTDAVVSLTAKQARFATAVAAATIFAALSSLTYSVVYVFDTLIRTKAPVQTEIVSKPDQLPLPVSLPQAEPNAAPPTPESNEADPALKQVPAPTSP